MYKVLILLFALIFAFGCSKSDKESVGHKQDDQSTVNSGREVTVEIHTSGMTCTGCEKTIKARVKKINGIKDVTADYTTNTVNATFDDSQTNQAEIEKVITSAGYKIEKH